MMRPDIHADDYGYSLNTSRDIIDCLKAGKLDSISLICNTSYFFDSMELLYQNIPSLPFMPKMAVHLNLVEGLFSSGKLPLSWSKLFIASYLPSGLKEVIKKEIDSQIDLYLEAYDKCRQICQINNVPFTQKGIRIDSHTHTHVLPIVWKALLEVIREKDCEIEFIRNPKEPLRPFLSSFFAPSFRKINYVKNILLNLYSGKVDRYCERKGLEKNYLWGLVMSGRMDKQRIDRFYEQMHRISEDDGRILEILFHPGTALAEEYSAEMNQDYFRDFNSSDNRAIEKQAVLERE